MSNLFSDSYIPPWLIQKETPVDALLKGAQAGSMIAHNMLQARQVEMQAEETTANVGRIMADTELKKQAMEQMNQENAAWMRNDAPTVSKWMTTPLGKLDTVATPEPKSQRGMDIVQKRIQAEEGFKLRDDQQKTMLELRKNQFEIDKIKAGNATGTEKALAEGDKDFVRGLEMIDANDRIAILGAEPKQPHFTPTQWGRLQDALKAKGITLPTSKAFKDPEPVLLQQKRDEYLKAGNVKAATEIDNILAAKGHLGLPKTGPGSGKLSGEDAVREKDLTKQIQSLETELNKARSDNANADKLIPLQERLLSVQSQRHKLYQKLAPKAESAKPAKDTGLNLSPDDFNQWLKQRQAAP